MPAVALLLSLLSPALEAQERVSSGWNSRDLRAPGFRQFLVFTQAVRLGELVARPAFMQNQEHGYLRLEERHLVRALERTQELIADLRGACTDPEYDLVSVLPSVPAVPAWHWKDTKALRDADLHQFLFYHPFVVSEVLRLEEQRARLPTLTLADQARLKVMEDQRQSWKTRAIARIWEATQQLSRIREAALDVIEKLLPEFDRGNCYAGEEGVALLKQVRDIYPLGLNFVGSYFNQTLNYSARVADYRLSIRLGQVFVKFGETREGERLVWNGISALGKWLTQTRRNATGFEYRIKPDAKAAKALDVLAFHVGKVKTLRMDAIETLFTAQVFLAEHYLTQAGTDHYRIKSSVAARRAVKHHDEWVKEFPAELAADPAKQKSLSQDLEKARKLAE